MPDALIWTMVVFFVLIPLIGLVALWPLYLYNIAWRIFCHKEPIFPVYVFSSQKAINGYSLYIRDTGWKIQLYGLVCLCHGLAIQLFTLSFFVDSCAGCKVTPFQQVTIWIFLATAAPLAVSMSWVPSGHAQRIVRPEEGEKLAFWHGAVRCIKRLISRDNSERTRRKSVSRSR